MKKILSVICMCSMLSSSAAFAAESNPLLDESIEELEDYLLDLDLLSGNRTEPLAAFIGAEYGFSYKDQSAEIEIYEYDIDSESYQFILDTGKLSVLGIMVDANVNHQYVLIGDNLSAELVDAFMAFPDGAASGSAAETDTELNEMPESIEELWAMYQELLGKYEKLKADYDALSADQPADEIDSDIFYESKNGLLVYDHCGYLTTYDGKNVIYLFFQYTNNSDSTTSAQDSFIVDLFQNGVKCQSVSLYGPDIKEADNWSTDVRPGTTINVAYSFYADEISGTSEIDLNYIDGWTYSPDEVQTFTIDLTGIQDLKSE